MTIDTSNSDFLWVCPSGDQGDGSWEKPFTSIKKALENAAPGKSIILKSGVYSGDLTIEISGSPELPIRILPEKNATVEINNGCWFFYDTSDIILSGLTFKNAAAGAISVIGACHRNLFDSLRFIDCGNFDKASCTLYFGGSGGECNLVENCLFERSYDILKLHESKKHNIVALMISGGSDESLPIKNHVVRKNSFVNYDFGLLIGSNDSPSDNQYGHIIEYNKISKCRSGIIVRCGDTLIKANCIEQCQDNPISIETGSGSTIEDNRIQDCRNGIRVHDSGHTISNNCFIRCKEFAITACGKSNSLNTAAENLFVESNTCVDCGTEAPYNSAILIEPGTTTIIRHNLLTGIAKSYSLTESITDSALSDGSAAPSRAHHVITDNLCSHGAIDGFTVQDISFADSNSGDFRNESGYGAKGWMLRPETFDPAVDEYSGETDYLEASILEDESGERIVPGKTGSSNPFAAFYSEDIFDSGSTSSEE